MSAGLSLTIIAKMREYQSRRPGAVISGSADGVLAFVLGVHFGERWWSYPSAPPPLAVIVWSVPEMRRRLWRLAGTAVMTSCRPQVPADWPGGSGRRYRLARPGGSGRGAYCTPWPEPRAALQEAAPPSRPRPPLCISRAPVRPRNSLRISGTPAWPRDSFCISETPVHRRDSLCISGTPLRPRDSLCISGTPVRPRDLIFISGTGSLPGASPSFPVLRNPRRSAGQS